MLEALDAALIAPIRWALLSVLNTAQAATGSWGWALVLLSGVVSLLLLPAHRWAERLQAQQRAVLRHMQPKIDEFRQVFRGHELHLMLRELYRVHGHHPMHALRGLAPLAIQLPLFIAAYGLLADHAAWQGVAFGPLADLGRPDGLMHGIHALPLAMTAINLAALELQTRGSSRAEWMQGAALAALFLVLLYRAPSALVLYWTLNNLASLGRAAWNARGAAPGSPASRPSSHAAALVAEAIDAWRGAASDRLVGALGPTLPTAYALACAACFVLLGVALPLGFTSLEDNIDGLAGYLGYFGGLCIVGALGFATIAAAWWHGVRQRARAWTVLALFTAPLLALAFAFVRPPDAGLLDNFVFFAPQALSPSAATLALDAALVAGVLMFARWLAVRHATAMRHALAVLAISGLLAAGTAAWTLQQRIDAREAAIAQEPGEVLFHFARRHPNVLLVFLDGAMSGYLPAILDDEPQLAAQLRGFRWFPNVISTGNRTINGLPSVFGGPDYTVGGINARRDGTLQQKVSDAYRVYVDNFRAKGYAVQYADPFWFGLARTGDCERFNAQYAADGQARCIHAIGRGVQHRKQQVSAAHGAEFFAGLARQYLAITLLRIAPHSLKAAVYDDGRWLSLSFAWKKRMDKYLDNVFSLDAMPAASAVDATQPTFHFVTNEAPRAPLLLDAGCLPEHFGARAERSHPRFADSETQKIFETHRCVLRGVGRFMQWLHGEGIADHTMVVLVSDHGWASDNPLLDGLPGQRTYSMFQAFLMVKDFGDRAALRRDDTRIANFGVPGLLCATIGGCIDRASGRPIPNEPLLGPLTLYETPWQPAGQTLHDYVVTATHENDGPVDRAGSWRSPHGLHDVAQGDLFADQLRAMPWLRPPGTR